MDWLTALPVWVLCIAIFGLRVADVTLGTLRTVAIVRGHITPAVVLGFFELLIWVAVISQVISRLHESWWLGLAYAAGFAAGNGVGVMVERRISRGMVAVRIFSDDHGDEIAEALRDQGHEPVVFTGRNHRGTVTQVQSVVSRRRVRQLVGAAQAVDADLIYLVDPAHRSGRHEQQRLRPVPNPTGWRAVVKKK